MREFDDGYGVYDDPDEPPNEHFWSMFWSIHYSYPERSGDYVSVTKPTDFESPRQLANSATGEFLRWNGARHAMIAPLPLLDSVDHRIMLWRMDGRDFSERDRLLLAMVRPHLVAIRDATLKRDPGTPPLTARQRQLLGHIAAGLTNRQIARQVDLSEHTVRKHIENIFERLEVNSRTAAVARAFPSNSSA